MTHGRYSTILRPAIKQRMAELEALDRAPLDLLPELKLLRALTIDFIERYDTYKEALVAWHQSFVSEDVTPKPRQILDVADAASLLVRISRLVELIHRMQQEQTISLETFRRLMEAMGQAVARHVGEPQTLAAIERDWQDIRVDAGREPRPASQKEVP